MDYNQQRQSDISKEGPGNAGKLFKGMTASEFSVLAGFSDQP